MIEPKEEIVGLFSYDFRVMLFVYQWGCSGLEIFDSMVIFDDKCEIGINADICVKDDHHMTIHDNYYKSQAVNYTCPATLSGFQENTHIS